MWMLKTGKPVNVPPLNDAMAIELGASIWGEAIIFIIAATIIIKEVIRQARKEERKEAKRKDEFGKLYDRLKYIDDELYQQENHIKNLLNAVSDLQYKLQLKPSLSPIKPSTVCNRELHSLPLIKKDLPIEQSFLSSDSTVEPSLHVPQRDNPKRYHLEEASGNQHEFGIPFNIVQREEGISSNNGVIPQALSYILDEIFKKPGQQYRNKNDEN